MAREKYLLKILSGPHQGAEVALDEGELVIGSSQNCDLIISDTLVSGEHLKIVVTDTGASIVPLASPVYYNGEEISKDEYFPVEPFKFISVGSTHFIIGPVEGEWPALSAADIPNLTRLEKEVEAAEEKIFEEKEIETLEGEGGPPVDLEPVPGSEISGFEKIWKEKKNWIIGATCLVLLILLAVGIVFWKFKKSPEVPEKVDEKAEIAKVIAITQFPQRFTIDEKEDFYYVKGWVSNNEEQNKIEESLRKLGPNIITELRSQDQAVENLKDFLNANQATTVFVETIEPGKVRLYGYYGDDAAWDRVKESVLKDMPGLKLVKDDVWTPNKLYPVISEVLNASNVTEIVQLVPQIDGIILKGVVSKADIPKVKEAILQFQSKVGQTIPIKNQIIVAKPEDLHLDLDMDSVIIGGGNAFIITKNGQRIFEGGVLKGAYHVEKISREGIILSKGDQKITLNLGENYD